jgi:hypothetical protein
LAMAGQIRRDHGVGAREAGDQVSPGPASATQSVNEQDCRPDFRHGVGDSAARQVHPVFHHRWCLGGASRRSRVGLGQRPTKIA